MRYYFGHSLPKIYRLLQRSALVGHIQSLIKFYDSMEKIPFLKCVGRFLPSEAYHKGRGFERGSGTIMSMLIMSFFSWWYGAGWRAVLGSFGPRLRGVRDGFSVEQLLRTLFSPWRRIISYSGKGLDAKLRAMGDNAVSRVIGFFVRFFVLLGALIATIAVLLFTTLELIIWPLLPLAIPGCLIAGLIV